MYLKASNISARTRFEAHTTWFCYYVDDGSRPMTSMAFIFYLIP